MSGVLHALAGHVVHVLRSSMYPIIRIVLKGGHENGSAVVGGADLDGDVLEV